MMNRLKVDDIMKQLKARTKPQALTPKQIWRQDIHQAITELDWEDAQTDPAVIALMAGLHLLNDNLSDSHSYCQQIEYEPTGDYWHAIMHRMEQDYWNSKYWFRQAGSHPVKQAMPRKAADYLKQRAELDRLPRDTMTDMLTRFRDQESWNSSDFVDLVEMQEKGRGTETTRSILEGLQQIEMLALMDYTYQKVYSG